MTFNPSITNDALQMYVVIDGMTPDNLGATTFTLLCGAGGAGAACSWTFQVDGYASETYEQISTFVPPAHGPGSPQFRNMSAVLLQFWNGPAVNSISLNKANLAALQSRSVTLYANLAMNVGFSNGSSATCVVDSSNNVTVWA